MLCVGKTGQYVQHIRFILLVGNAHKTVMDLPLHELEVGGSLASNNRAAVFRPEFLTSFPFFLPEKRRKIKCWKP